MLNRFENILRFVNISETSENTKNLFSPVSKLDILPAQHLDFWRVLLPKSDFRSLDIAKTKLSLLRRNPNIPAGFDILANTDNIGSIRLQDTENYTLIRIAILSVPDGENYRQFAITRPNGDVVLGTFTGQQTNLIEYASALKSFYEDYPYAPVFVEQNGGFLSIKIYNNENFILENETLTIGIGVKTEFNTNTPLLTATKINTVVVPAKDRYSIKIGSVQEGNIFTLNGTSYLVKAKDTIDDVLFALIGKADYLEVAANAPVSVQIEPGERIVKNTSVPIVNYVLHHPDATYNYWNIVVTGTIKVGNYIEVSGPGAATLHITVTATDTLSTLQAQLNPTGGYFRTLLGASPVISVVSGQLVLPNTTTPTFYVHNKTTIAAQTVDRYLIVVGSDIAEGNQFHLDDIDYTAGYEDTVDEIVTALGGAQNAFIYVVPQNQLVNAYAERGYRHTDRHIADIQILEQPVVRRSPLAVCEFTFPDNLSGILNVGILDNDSGDIIAVSNSVRLAVKQPETSIVEVGGTYEFGYEYHESMLTQRLRLPLFVKPPKNKPESTFGTNLSGTPIKMNTSIVRSSEFVTHQLYPETANALTAWLQHRLLIINNQQFLQIGSFQEEILSIRTGRKQLFGELQYCEEKNNFPNLFQGFYIQAYGQLSIHGHGLQIYLKSNSFVRLMSSDPQSLPPAEYQLEFQAGPDTKRIQVFRNGYKELTIVVPRQKRSRLGTFLRVNAHDNIILNIINNDESFTTTFEQQLTPPTAESITYTHELASKYLYNQFSNAFSEDYKI